MRLLYQIGIYALELIFWIGQFVHKKLRLGYLGRKNWREDLKNFKASARGRIIWIHAASLGEFEMARPLIEELGNYYKEEASLLLTFFSPSGFEVRKKYDRVAGVMYLPMDTRENAQDFIGILKPEIAVFVKYEFWLNYLSQLKKQGVRTLLINGIFRKDQPFFRWYGKVFRKALSSFDHLFVQNRNSAALLALIGIENTTVTGDIRYDRVLSIAQAAGTSPWPEHMFADSFVVAGGSTWPEEEYLLRKLLDAGDEKLRLIIAPHDISEGHLRKIEKQFEDDGICRFTALQEKDSPRVLLLDTIGHLSSLYKYTNLALVGGGFGGALHNILEPAVFGIPVFFGSLHQKFPEARYFIDQGIGFSVNSSADFLHKVGQFRNDRSRRDEVRSKSGAVFKSNSGGTHQIFYKIKGYLS